MPTCKLTAGGSQTSILCTDSRKCVSHWSRRCIASDAQVARKCTQVYLKCVAGGHRKICVPSADTGCVPVANRKEVSAVTCVQTNPVACTLDLVSQVSAGICEHQGTLLRFHIS
ncbi:uncharacterized protein LACBIDRAFT_315345 [Laccaria bicolor S238N-H82]|uniref:Predicted protein n=1 Tax=Laccaria bicolor (strain S238N-H82 / ATCC MYA-4686) TaxID=486041 RepID=B0D265_LACBS|nr:uncharacterized protein LACBIDRAFT_315345 [Laccaria bicolor S238N-H82]EDR10689.1 predicted protein [Laccaria bicolor S238N-H82]|eukprot:XP_001877990.1 predicted protein [Laccaria bicolor S238N-H82]